MLSSVTRLPFRPLFLTSNADPTGTTVTYNSQDSTVLTPGTVVIPGVQAVPAVGDGSTPVSGTSPATGVSPQEGKLQLDDPLPPSGPNQYVYTAGDKNEVYANAFGAAAHTIDVFSQVLGQPLHWSFGHAPLEIHATRGHAFDAYYDPETDSLNFGHNEDAKTNQVIYAGNSGEVVSHETGHAILDALRPAYLGSVNPEPGAFHESWGDMMAMCMAFQDPAGIAKVVQQTGGDLSKPNACADIGEQMGMGINDAAGTNSTGGNFVRTALNSFVYADPTTLPDNGDATHLGSEIHDFSRLWTGAFYDVLQGINKQNLAASPGNPTAALQATGQEAIQLLAEIVKGAPQGEFTFRDMANAWIATDRASSGGKRADLITQVMTARGILGATPPAPPHGVYGQLVAPSEDPTPRFTMTPNGLKPLQSVAHPVTAVLTNVPAPFDGALITLQIDNNRSAQEEVVAADRTTQTLASLIKAGRILVTTPGAHPTTAQLFDSKGRPYIGMLVYHPDGSKSIERVKILT